MPIQSVVWRVARIVFELVVIVIADFEMGSMPSIETDSPFREKLDVFGALFSKGLIATLYPADEILSPYADACKTLALTLAVNESIANGGMPVKPAM